MGKKVSLADVVSWRIGANKKQFKISKKLNDIKDYSSIDFYKSQDASTKQSPSKSMMKSSSQS